MSRNGSRWYTFGRKTPLATREVGPIEPGTVYQFIGWSRTEDAALDKRDKLDRAGRAGINIFAPSRQKAMASLAEIFDGVVVEGYISPANKRAGRQLVRARRPDVKDRSGRGLDKRAAIEAELDPDPYLSAALAEAEWDAEEGDE